jgi:RimJ/RimL family protein N-acetyltransferase
MNKSGNIIYNGTMQGFDVTVRYPQKEDLASMHTYINEISKEKTYITYQGEQISLEDEEKYLNGQLEKINKNEVVQLLLFVNNEFSGVSEIKLGQRVENHVGTFGITISQKYRGKGFGKLLMKCVLEESSKNLPTLRLVILKVFAENEIAKKMYESFGFKENGRLPKGIQYRGKDVDEIEMYKMCSNRGQIDDFKKLHL